MSLLSNIDCQEKKWHCLTPKIALEIFVESSCLSFIAVCRKLLGISLGSRVVHVRPLDPWCARASTVRAVCLRLGCGVERAFRLCGKTSLLLSPSSSCGHSSSPSKHPSIQHLFPSQYNPQMCVRFLRATENVV